MKPNPRSSTVDEGAGITRSERVDLVIGLGGGSAFDAAKGIALASSGTKSIWDYVGVRVEIEEGSVPVFPSMERSASALKRVLDYYSFKSSTGT